MPHKIKVQAKEVSEAIAKGLKQLGLRRDQVEITVLENPRKGFLGIGSKPAIVELRQKRWNSSNLDAQIYMDVPNKRRNSRRPQRGGKRKDRSYSRHHEENESRQTRERTPKANEPQLLPCEAIQNAVIPDFLKQPMAEAKEHLSKVLEHMGIKAENLNVWWDEKQQRILLTFDCDKPAIVIGKEGKTLEAIQYLCTLSLSRHFDKPISVVADTQNYWRKAEDKINAEIERGIDMIKRGNSIYRFRPMPAQLRRYIHRAVEGNEYVMTASEGEGQWRKVTFRPTEKIIADLQAAKAPSDFVPGVIGEDVSPAPAEESASAPVVTETVTETIVQTPQVTLVEQTTEVVLPATNEPTGSEVAPCPQPEDKAPAAAEPIANTTDLTK